MKRTLLATAAALMLAAPAPAAADPALLTMSWDEIVAQAQAEGTVNWFVWYFQPRFREIAAAFTEEFGIEVVIPEGTHQGNFDKFLAERDRETGDIDLLAIGAERIETFDYAATTLGPLAAVLPNAATMMDEIGGFDGDGHGWAFWGNQTGIAYDPEQIAAEDLPQTLDELSAFMTANPGRFGLNFEGGGSGPSFIQSVARNLVPEIDYADGTVTDEKLAALQPAWDWFLAHSDGFVITASNADSLIRLSAGEFTMVPAWEDHLFTLQDQGEVDPTLAHYLPAWGAPGGGNFNVIPANAPNPAAALVFMNWLSSAEIQTLFNEISGVVPVNTEASDAHALIPAEQRVHSRQWVAQPFGAELLNAFIENVALER
jgi:putative spermidine/putrescine transport system substrate-binding protein